MIRSLSAAPEVYRAVTACRSCRDDNLTTVLDLGNLAVSDFLDPGQEPNQAPLELVRCGGCGLVQLRHTVDRDRLYRHYHYRSGVNETMIAALRDVVVSAQKVIALEPGDWVLDIGSNDGTLLDQYPPWIKTVGFEPSDVARKDSHHFVVPDYFPPTQYPVTEKPCKIITAVAMFYDLDDPGAFLEECKRWLHPEGVLVLQFQDLWSMVQADAIDNVCHEHLTYWTEEALSNLAVRHDLVVEDWSAQSINGGSLRFMLRRLKHGARWLAHPGVSPEDLRLFADRVQRNKHDTVVLLRRLKAEGKRVCGIAASTKFNTLSQFYGIGPDLIESISERSPEKVGKTTVTGIPIVSEDEMRAARPDYLFTGAWQFAEAFAERERSLLEQGTKLIIPLPTLRIVGGGVVADVLTPSPA